MNAVLVTTIFRKMIKTTLNVMRKAKAVQAGRTVRATLMSSWRERVWGVAAYTPMMLQS